MPSVFGSGVSALQAFQRALDTTGHNIANANTPGYSRQRVELSPQPPQSIGGSFIGRGVEVDSVRRVHDAFVTSQVRDSQSALAQQQAYAELASRVDNLLADGDSGLAPALQKFFNSVQTLADDPTSTASRQVVLAEGRSLASRFGQLDGQLEQTRSELAGRIRAQVSGIDAAASRIADLNDAIVSASGGGGQPNDLLDQRDRAIERLSERVGVSTVAQGDGSINVFVGDGQALVLGARASTLTATALGEDPDRLGIGLAGPNGTLNIGARISRGALGGVLESRDQVLAPAQNALGRIAIGLASGFNAQHGQGLDLDGNAGQDFFNIGQPQVLGHPDNGGTGAVQVAIDDPAGLTTDDYRLRFDDGAVSLTRASDGQPVPFESGSGTGGDPFVAAGLSIVTDGSASDGDSYLIRPTRAGAGSIEVALSEPRAIAASAGGAVGDNANALELAGLQSRPTLSNGTASLEDAYGALVADVGTRTQEADVSAQAQESLLQQAQARRESVSGVNLDEEAADLLRFQQGYQAAAQVISTADSIFQTLIGAVRR